MDEMKEAVGNWREAKQFSPADENDFLRWLDKADTEEKLFSRLTFWFTFRGLPADQNQRYHLVQERARELRLWNGLELKLRRWQDRVADEYEQIGKEAFAARIGEDYADYINSLTDPEAAPQQAAPEPETAKPAGVQAWSARELSEMVLPPIRHVVEGLLPMGMGVLVAKPKLGKSWMVLDLCLAVAQGEPFLGFPTRQHGTLYLALEDGKSRMQTRLRRLLEGRPAPANMHVMFQAQRLGEGLLEKLGGLRVIGDYLAGMEDPSLVRFSVAIVGTILANFESSSIAVLGLVIPVAVKSMAGSTAVLANSISLGVLSACLVVMCASPFHIGGALILSEAEDYDKTFRHLLWWVLALTLVMPFLTFLL